MSATSWLSKVAGTELNLDNLQNLLQIQLQDLVSAEDQLIEALPKMADAASCAELQNAFLTHLEETQQQRSRLDRAFQLLGVEPETETCEAMQGLIKEGNEIINLSGHPQVKDAALIAAAQRVEHYEMAAYGSARAFARQLGRDDIAELLQDSLDEEGNADDTLSEIAEGHINAQAGRA